MKNECYNIQFDFMFGALVQLVRMPACHAGGHEFESRTHRQQHKSLKFSLQAFLLPFSQIENFPVFNLYISHIFDGQIIFWEYAIYIK